jgi:hypothetical protein
MDLDRLGIHLKTRVLVDEEVLYGVALVSLQLDDIAGFLVTDDGAVACELLFDHFEYLLQVELGWDALDCCESLAAIALLDTDVNIWCEVRGWMVVESRNSRTYGIVWSSVWCRLCPGLAHPRRDLVG